MNVAVVSLGGAASKKHLPVLMQAKVEYGKLQ